MSEKKKSDSGEHALVKRFLEVSSPDSGPSEAAKQSRTLERVTREFERFRARGRVDPRGARSTIRQSATDIGEILESLRTLKSGEAAEIAGMGLALQSELATLDERDVRRTAMIARFVAWRDRALHEIGRSIDAGEVISSRPEAVSGRK